MTRRIVSAILLTVWATLLVGGAAAYLAVRAVMLSDLDASIVARATSLGGDDRAGATPAEYAGDRYLITGERGQTISRVPSQVRTLESPEVMHRDFTSLGDGTSMRTLTLSTTLRGDGGSGQKVKIIYSAPAATFDRALARLAWTIGLTGAAAGVLAALIAVWVARRALRPMHQAAAVIGSIDEKSLDRRIDVAPLPPELQPVAIRLNEMLATLERAFEKRRQFLADASHELRTPLAALLTTLEVALHRPRAEAELRQALERSLGSAHAMHSLVDQLLEQVRNERFSGDEPAEPLRPAECVEQVASELKDLADSRQVRFEVTGDSSLCIRSQSRRLRGILMNLMSNAVHHHAGGTVWVTIQGTPDSIVLTVRDDGPGIAPQHQTHVFEPFYRVSSSRGGDDGHLGLGLFQVLANARALGGKCELTSVVGQGTTVRITLPMSNADRAMMEGLAPKNSSSADACSTAASSSPVHAMNGECDQAV